MNYSEVVLPSNKKFGFFFSAIFLIMAAYFYVYREDNIIGIYAFVALSATCLLITLSKPVILRPFNKLWMRFGLLLGMIVNPIVLGIIFFIIFTPTACLLRIAKRDELRLRFSKKNTYWISRSSSSQCSSFKQQF